MIEITYNADWSSTNSKVYNYDNPEYLSIDVIKRYLIQKLSFHEIESKINFHIEGGHIFFTALDNLNNEEKTSIFELIDQTVKGFHLITQSIETTISPLSAFSPFQSPSVRQTATSIFFAPNTHSNSDSISSTSDRVSTLKRNYSILFKELLNLDWDKNNTKLLKWSDEQLANRYPGMLPRAVYKNMYSGIYRKLKKDGWDYKKDIKLKLSDSTYGDCLAITVSNNKYRSVVDDILEERQTESCNNTINSSNNPDQTRTSGLVTPSSQTVSRVKIPFEFLVSAAIESYQSPSKRVRTAFFSVEKTTGTSKQNSYFKLYGELLNAKWNSNVKEMRLTEEVIDSFPHKTTAPHIFKVMIDTIRTNLMKCDPDYLMGITISSKDCFSNDVISIEAVNRKYQLMVDLRLAQIVSDPIQVEFLQEQLVNLPQDDAQLKENIYPENGVYKFS